MKLYYFPVAPNPTKVRVYLAEKGITDLEMVRVSLPEGAQRSSEFLEKNPRGKLPVLELDDGSYLSESLPIIEYLEERYPEPPMIGETPEERARTRMVERIAEMGAMGPIARAVHSSRSPLGLPANPEVAASAMEALEEGIGHLDAILANARFLAGDRVSIADCTLWAALGFGSVFGIEISEENKNVARWREEFGKRPSVQLPG